MDNPIMQVTSWAPGGDVQHEKTDVFLDRMAFVGTIGERIRAAIARKVDAAAVKALSAIERELLEDGRDVPQYHSAWLGVYLGYRERKAYDKMVALFPKLPKELRQTAVAREQLALALNRLAERADRRGRRGVKRARELRRQALAELDKMPRKMVTSETCGIRGRIYKGWHDAEAKAGRVGRAQGMLSRAIETYEQGLRLDARDFYPGVNAVTLRLLRGTPRDLAAVARIAPVVRFAVESAPAPKSEEERYWRAATKLELAGADRDWTAADRYLTEALGIDAQDWMFETTVKNLRIQRAAFVRDEEAVERLDEIIECLVD